MPYLREYKNKEINHRTHEEQNNFYEPKYIFSYFNVNQLFNDFESVGLTGLKEGSKQKITTNRYRNKCSVYRQVVMKKYQIKIVIKTGTRIIIPLEAKLISYRLHFGFSELVENAEKQQHIGRSLKIR